MRRRVPTGSVGAADVRPTGTVASVPARERITAALDVGGTSIKPGVVRGDAVELRPAIPSRSKEIAAIVLDQLATAAETAVAAAGPSLSDLAIAVPRPFDLERGIPLLRGLHKFDSIHGVELQPILRARTSIGSRSIGFVGDAEAAAVGEARFGAGRGVDRVLMITLGTGMGACLTDGGRVVAAVGDASIEDLHDRLVDGVRADDVFSARGLSAALDVDADQLPVAVADPMHAERLLEFGRQLGSFLTQILDEFGIHAVVVGGGLSAIFERFGPALAITARPAALGPRGPLLGAAALTAEGT
jgi:glucokinase